MFEPEHPYKFFLFVIVTKAIQWFSRPRSNETRKVLLQLLCYPFGPLVHVTMDKRQSDTVWHRKTLVIDCVFVWSNQNGNFYTATHALPV